MAAAYNIPPPKGYIKKISNTAIPSETVKSMQRIVKRDYLQLIELAQALERESTEATCKAIYQFVKNNIEYRLDPKVVKTQDGEFKRDFTATNGDENLQTPSFTYWEAAGDCDDMVIFVSALLCCLNIQHAYKIAAYTDPQQFEHIYTIAYSPSGEAYIIDTVPEIPRFNFEAKYINSKIFLVDMKTYELGGINTMQMQKTTLSPLEEFLSVNLPDEQTVEPSEFSLSVAQSTLLRVRQEITARPDWFKEPAAQQEVILIDAVLASFQNPAELAETLQQARKNSNLPELYKQIIDMIVESSEMNPTTPKEFAGLGFLNIGEIVGGVDKLFGGERRRLEEQRKIAEEQRKAVEAQAQSQKELALIQQQTAQIEASRSSKSGSGSEAEAANPDDKTFFQKYGLYIGIAAAALIAVVVYFLTRPKKNALKGVRRRRRKPATATATRRRRPRTMGSYRKVSTTKRKRRTATKKRATRKK